VNGAQESGFRLATFKSAGKPQVGMVEKERIIEINHAFSFLSDEEKKNLEPAMPIVSMEGLLENWEKVFPFLCKAANLLTRTPQKRAIWRNVGEVILLAPVTTPGKMINTGLNFHDHAREMDIDVPSSGFQPNFFFKGDRNCIIGSGQKIELSSNFVDWEAELALVIGKKGKDIKPEDAPDYIAGYTCHNDITDRSLMIRKDGSLDFFRGKSRDTFGPLGPFLVPKEFFPGPDDLRIRCFVNGEVMQDFSTAQMIWGPEKCIAYISSCVTLMPGDIIALGTGAGTGWAKGLPDGEKNLHRILELMEQGGGRFLRPGDCVVVEIEGIGRLENEVK